MKVINKELSSFRDPSGYIYYQNNEVYRKINTCYLSTFNKFSSSNLFKTLINNKWLIKHKVIENDEDSCILKVQKIPFISYPYEWCFDQLKDAALLTLNIEKLALENNYTLKDASAYNIQFIGSKPIFIDTLSFMEYEEGVPWGGYGQFCRHFLAPLLLMTYIDHSLNCLLKNYIDGIPINIASNILQKKGGLIAWEHIKLHDKLINKSGKHDTSSTYISKKKMLNIINMLIRQINNLNKNKAKTAWENYYNDNSYSQISFNSKKQIIGKYLESIKGNNNDLIFDIGANDGTFSTLALKNNYYVVASDVDHNSVNKNYCIYRNTDSNMLPLILDFNNPSPAIGFDLTERQSIKDRVDAKCIMALALIHHICISNNVPFDYFFKSISEIGKYLIIEFIPKDDSKVIELLKNREDIFENYNINSFELCAKKYFKIIQKDSIKDSKRVLYLMEKKYEKTKKSIDKSFN